MNNNIRYHQYIKKILLCILLLLSIFNIGLIKYVRAEQIIIKSYVYSEDLSNDEIIKYEKSMIGSVGGLNLNKTKLTKDMVIELVGDDAKNIVNLPTTYIRPSKAKGYGKTSILDKNNIVGITEEQYISALITAGALDSNVSIISDRPIDPVYGLVGVYAAYQDAGQPLNKDSIQLAQEELKIYKEINNTYGEDKTKLILLAMSEIKYNIQNKFLDYDNKISGDKIIKEIEIIGKNYNMSDIINHELLGEYFEQFSNLQFNNDQMDSIEMFGKRIINSGASIFEKVKSEWSDLDEGDKNQILEFFIGAMELVVDLAIWLWSLLYSVVVVIWNLIKDLF